MALELRLKLHMMRNLLKHKSAQNDSIKGEMQVSLYVALEGAPNIYFRKHSKMYRKVKKKIYFMLQ